MSCTTLESQFHQTRSFEQNNYSPLKKALSQVSILALTFGSPFAVAIGTGGDAQAQHVESTGISNFVIGTKPQFKVEKPTTSHANTLQSFIDIYGLEKSQTAKLLNVSRPTIDSWLDGKSNKIRSQNSKRLTEMFESFEAHTNANLKPLTGQLLRKKLDPTVRSLFHLATQENIEKADLMPLIKSINFKLAGLEKSSRLSQSLSKKSPLV